jgi:hypothetical protein
MVWQLAHWVPDPGHDPHAVVVAHGLSQVQRGLPLIDAVLEFPGLGKGVDRPQSDDGLLPRVRRRLGRRAGRRLVGRSDVAGRGRGGCGPLDLGRGRRSVVGSLGRWQPATARAARPRASGMMVRIGRMATSLLLLSESPRPVIAPAGHSANADRPRPGGRSASIRRPVGLDWVTARPGRCVPWVDRSAGTMGCTAGSGSVAQPKRPTPSWSPTASRPAGAYRPIPLDDGLL